jgi:hypothetical protein
MTCIRCTHPAGRSAIPHHSNRWEIGGKYGYLGLALLQSLDSGHPTWRLGEQTSDVSCDPSISRMGFFVVGCLPFTSTSDTSACRVSLTPECPAYLENSLRDMGFHQLGAKPDVVEVKEGNVPLEYCSQMFVHPIGYHSPYRCLRIHPPPILN